jgi:hypothetical protein
MEESVRKTVQQAGKVTVMFDFQTVKALILPPVLELCEKQGNSVSHWAKHMSHYLYN